MNLGVLGAGAWGTALAISLSAQHRVTLWARDGALAHAVSAGRENARYLPGCAIPDAVTIGADPRLVSGCDVLLCSVPTAGLRDVLSRFAGSTVPMVLACKGFEQATGLLPHEVFAAVLPGRSACVLSGPSFAREVAAGLPAAVVLAAADAALAARLARELHSPRLRVYSNDDLVGVEVAGATKNVMAIAAGICDGLRLGANARAAMITRGLAEMSRLGVVLGGRSETFMGLAGAGDLILTCTGDLSRNRTVGLRLAAGASLGQTLATLGHVAEGVSSAYEIERLAQRHGVDMPITRAVCALLRGESSPAAAVAILLERDPKAEF
ncbi:MAG: NAD(P)-dependent glycerol-3-phosphate dehydrogenase [Burkholderiales bacterium]|nr:NAD(P)-dependent glycerol-3-phosphate dehydrogenase [Burkholderiales bacterium]